MKLFIVVLSLLLLTGVAEAGPAHQNTEIWSPAGGGEKGILPPTQVIKVRYARGAGASEISHPTLASGDVVIWDTASLDCVTISGCVSDNDPLFAGVLVTTIQTSDLNDCTTDGSDRNWGYMAIKGYCLAKVDTSNAATGGRLVTNGATVDRSFGTSAYFSVAVSGDVGALINDIASDGLCPVWLN